MAKKANTDPKPTPETKKPKIGKDSPFPDLPPPPPFIPKKSDPETNPEAKSPYTSQLRTAAEADIKSFDDLSEDEIQGRIRARLWPRIDELIDRMFYFATQNQNFQVAERTTSKLIDRVFGKTPSTKLELGEEEKGFAVTMHSDLGTDEDDIPDGTEPPEGFVPGTDDDEAALLQEDAANDPDDEDEDGEDEDDE